MDDLIDRSPGLRDLQAHGLHLLAARHWRALGRPVPEELAIAELWTAFRTNEARRLLEYIRIACTGPIILIKGPAVATAYPDQNLRPFLDLDVLVDDPVGAQNTLVRAGFEPVASMLHPETVHHLQPLQLSSIPLSVELHRHPKWIDALDIPTFDELVGGAEPAALGVDGILTLRPPQHALVLTAHLWAHDPLARLLRVLDVAAVAERADKAELEGLVDAWGMQRPWRMTVEVADALFRGRKQPLPLRTWARNLTTAREATVLEMHVARCLAPFSVHPPYRAARVAGAALAGLLRPQPHESWRGKLTRSTRQLADPSMRRSEHARAVAENLMTVEPERADTEVADQETAGTALPRDDARGRRAALAWLAVTSVWAAAAALAVTLDAPVAYRAPIVLSFLLICPGLTIVRVLRIAAATVQLALGVALSMALAVLVPAALLYAGAWSPKAALILLIALTIAVAVIEAARGPAGARSRA